MVKINFLVQELKNQSCLKNHVRYAHTTVQAYKCNVCGSAFKRDFDLKTHMKKHMSTESWSCEVKLVFIRHMRNLSEK